MKVRWDLKLFYKNKNDTKIVSDFSKIEQACNNFTKKYKSNHKYLTSPSLLLKALKDYEQVRGLLDSAKPLIYFYYQNCLNSSDRTIEAKFNELFNNYNQAGNKVVFFENSLESLKPSQQKKILNDNLLKDYTYYLKTLFKWHDHILSDEAEQIMNLKQLPSHQLWIQNNDRVVDRQQINFKGKNISINEALNIINSLPTNQRRLLHTKTFNKLKEISEISEMELNAILLNSKIDNQIRNFTEPYKARLLSDQMDDETVNILLKTVSKNFNISHEFYKVKSKLLKLSKLKYEDRSAEIGKFNKKFTFTKTIKILTNLYTELDKNFTKIFNSYLNRGQIDVYPQVGKRGGAFCSWTNNNPTMILMNYTSDHNSLFTLAHEMGHALHAEYSKKQKIFYRNCSTATAEVASTLFENILYDKLIAEATKQDKIYLLHNRLNGDVASIFRQTAFYNFELELHNEFKNKSYFSKELMAKLFNKHLKSYLGPQFELQEHDGYGYVYTSHFRNFFYVYSYVYGQLISRTLSERLKADKNYIKEIIRFLESGGSQSPTEIFKSMNLDVTKQNFWETSLKYIQTDIDNLKSLI